METTTQTLPETNSKRTWKLMVGIFWLLLLGWPIFRWYVGSRECMSYNLSSKSQSHSELAWIPFTFPFIHDSKPICIIMEKVSQEGATPFITWFLPIFQDFEPWPRSQQSLKNQELWIQKSIPIHGWTKYYWDTRDHWNLYHVRI